MKFRTFLAPVIKRRALLCVLCICGFVCGLISTNAGAQMLTGYDQVQSAPAPVAPVITRENSPFFNPVLTAGTAPVPRIDNEPPQNPVDFQAGTLVHNEQNGTVTALDDVFMVQDGRILRADEISYNLNTGTVTARGHVVLNEESGDIYYADSLTLEKELKDGAIQGLQAYLQDGGRFSSAQGLRENGNRTTMKNASYTPCVVCDAPPYADQQSTPVWRMRASDVVHDKEAREISYKNARLEVYGVPVLYTPYFFHPDGTIKRKSGFLSPSAGYKSDLGTFLDSQYYWDIAPDQDATLGLIAMTQQAPLFYGQWRRRWAPAMLEINGGVTYAERTDSIGGADVLQDEDWRGHILVSGLWDMNENWRSGMNLRWASDDQYMRQYDFVDDDVLESEVYAERFSGRNYAAARLLTFQDIRIRENRVKQPEVLPEIVAGFKGAPNGVPVLGGRWGVDASFLGLQRDGNEQDMNRFVASGEWFRRLVSDYGLAGHVQAAVRSDLYHTQDREVAQPGSGQENEVTDERLFSSLHMQFGYPVAKPLSSRQIRLEPLAALTLAPNSDVNNNIPNEDSQDVQIDAIQLFEPNRFPGLDRIEDKSRLTYGMRMGLYEDDGGHTDVFLGQSRRFDEDDNPFPEGSGLDRQSSDIVGQISSLYDRYGLDYRFQFASDDMTSQRHEVDVSAAWDRLSIAGQYLFAKALGGTSIDESREQLKMAAGYYVTPDWRLRLGGTQDLGETPGLRKSYAGIDFFGQCLSWSLIAERNLTDDSSGDSALEILFRLGLKNLGGFEESDVPQACVR